MKFSDMLLHAWQYYQALHFPENHTTLPELYAADANWPSLADEANCCQNIYLHGVVGVLVVKDKGFLDQLVVSFQLVDLWFVIHNAFLVLPQVVELVLQGPMHLY